MQDLRASLPATWDFGRDLFVLVGSGTEGLAGSLSAAGQVRLFVLLPAEADAARFPRRAVIVRTAEELLTAVGDLPGAPPAHAVVRKTADPWASDAVLQAAARSVRDALGSRRLLATTVERHGSIWLRHGLANLARLASTPSVASLAGAFRGQPCVVVSPGPSLSRNVHLLKEVRAKALILSGTHALAALQRAGAQPHLLMAADPGDLEWHFHGVDLRPIEAFLVGATCRPENLARPVRRLFSFASNASIDDWIFEALGEDATVPSGGSVACSSVGLALRMGCDPIVLVGQDLSFPDQRAYAEETLDGNARVTVNGDGSFYLRKPGGAAGPGGATADGGLRYSRDQALREVPGYHGGTVPTSESFYAFLRWFEAFAAEHAGRTRLVNCTEGGARIAGMEQRTLAEMLAGWSAPLPDVGAALDAAVAGLDVAARRERLTGRVRDMLAALEPCLELAGECRRLAGAAAPDRRRLERLAAHERRLSRALAPVRLFSLVAQGEIVAAQEEARVARSLEQNLAAARRLFAVVERAVRELRDPLREARSALAAA